MIQINFIFALILGGGWLFGKLFAKIKLPSVLGMVIFGILCSLFLKKYTPEILWEIAPFLKSFALIVILLRAGLGIKREVLKRVGITAILMAFIPCIIEGTALMVLFHFVFKFNWFVSGLTGFMLAAVSPAVIVPSMLELKKEGHNEVPTIVMAGASIDDVFAITIFTVFLGLSNSESVNIIKTVLSIPISLIIGISSGLILGFALSFYFKKRHEKIRATEKALLLLVFGTLLVQVGDHFHFASLLGIMTAGFIMLERHEVVAHEMSEKFSKIWIFAEIILFVLIGYSLDITTGLQAGLKGLFVIVIGLFFRSAGVLISTLFSKLNVKERLFCVIAYLPKATVQAALGGVALSYGLKEGNIILAIAVLAILFTAPLGLFGIKYLGRMLLKT